jgi:hypothetical protein
MANQTSTISPEAIYQLSTKLFEFGRSPRLFSPEFRADLRLAAHMLRQLLFEGIIMKEIELTEEAERYVYQAGDLTVPLPPADNDAFLIELTGAQREALRNLIEIARNVDGAEQSTTPEDDRDFGDLDRIMQAITFAATKRSWLATASNMEKPAGESEV